MSLRQTHIPLPKIIAGCWADWGWLLPWVGDGRSPAWAMGQNSANCKRWLPGCSSSTQPPLLTAPLLVSLCLQLPGLREQKVAPGFAWSSDNLFSLTSGEKGYVPTSCKPNVPHQLPGEMCYSSGTWSLGLCLSVPAFDLVQHSPTPIYCKCRRIKSLWIRKRMKLEKQLRQSCLGYTRLCFLSSALLNVSYPFGERYHF